MLIGSDVEGAGTRQAVIIHSDHCRRCSRADRRTCGLQMEIVRSEINKQRVHAELVRGLSIAGRILDHGAGSVDNIVLKGPLVSG